MQIDDRRSHELQQPWVIVTPEGGVAVELIARDDGSDEADRYAGDRLFVARTEVPADTRLDIRIADLGPEGEVIESRSILVPAGAVKRLSISLQAPEAATASAEEQHPAAPPPGGQEGRSLRTERLAPMMAPWPSGTAPLGLAVLGGFVGVGVLARRLGDRVVAELLALAALLRGLSSGS